jgi:tetratricopeptide (TPR) repeat protein
MHFFLTRRVLALCGVALGTSFFLSGCGAQQGANGPASVSSVLAGAGRSIGAARAYDYLTRAMEAGDADAFLQGTAELQQNGAWPLVHRMVQSLVSSARSFSDAELLNRLGYTLAEKGEYSEQFAAAEAMTRRAVTIYDETIALLERGAAGRPEAARALGSVRFSRANIRDSLAWSLFRQKRYQEALREQEQALPKRSLSGGVR